MWLHRDLSPGELKRQLRNGGIRLAGNRRLKIFGRLDCPTGRRCLKRENRVFFRSEAEARGLGYRPCARCLPEAYRSFRAPD